MIIEEPKETLPVETILPERTIIEPIETIFPVYAVVPVEYTDKQTIIEKTIYKIEKLVGLQAEVTEEEINEIAVKQDGIIIAIIPPGSKFNGVEVHKICLAYQYGTDNWYNCEMEIS
jgi:hypothetical protein